MYTPSSLLLSLILTVCVSPIYSHPQCLNFQPPFRDTQVGYCTEYKDYGCCWRVTDRRARKKVDFFLEILSVKMDETFQSECRPYLRNISCLFCNPYAAHLFDIEESAVQRPFPWLCRDYCIDAYRHCYPVLLDMFKLKHADFGITESPASPSVVEEDARSFCSQVIAEESPYCYPQVLDGPQIPGLDPDQVSGDLNCICGDPVASGLRNPLVAVHSGDRSGRLFIAEQIGVIRVLTATNTLLPLSFLDISDSVLTSSRVGDERGLLGLAFHPHYADNGKFYVYYSTRLNGAHWSRVSEFTVSNADVNLADGNSEREIWSVIQPAGNHNGGQLLFQDGFLLIFLGDGGGAGDIFRNGLNRGTWHGSVLRIDVDHVDPSRGTNYAIPPDNPFISHHTARPEIFAYGVRNPWRCSIDRGDSVTGEGQGRIFCGDVGQSKFEEIDIIENGKNYGWRAFEGNSCFDSSLCANESLGPFEPPIDVYGHTVGVSVTGGFVYRGCLYPNLRGLYIFGDYGSGRLFSLRESAEAEGGSRWQRTDLCMGDSSSCIGSLVGQERERFVLAFGEDEDGELYILTTSRASSADPVGVVYHIVDPSRRESPASCRTLRSL